MVIPDKGIRKLTNRFGHRAVFIWLFSFLYVLVGVVTAFMPMQRIEELFHTHIPTWLRCALWVVTALVALSCSRMQKGELQWVSFIALAIMPGERFLSFMGGSVYILFNGYTPIFWQRLSGAITYLLWLTTLWLISTWKDEVDVEAIAEHVMIVPEQTLHLPEQELRVETQPRPEGE
jgi:hypothetical protein